MTKEHLEGRAEALGEVIATLDERLAKGCGSWVYELRQELARVKGNCERRAEQSTPDYERRKAYDEGWEDGKIIGFANGFDEGYDVCANDHDLVLNTGRTMRGSDEYNAAMSRATNYSPDKI